MTLKKRVDQTVNPLIRIKVNTGLTVSFSYSFAANQKIKVLLLLYCTLYTVQCTVSGNFVCHPPPHRDRTGMQLILMATEVTEISHLHKGTVSRDFRQTKFCVVINVLVDGQVRNSHIDYTRTDTQF